MMRILCVGITALRLVSAVGFGFVALPAGALEQPMKVPRLVSRRAVGFGFVALPASALEQPMKTSSDFGSFESLTGQSRGANLGAGSVSGKSRPVTNCILVAEPRADGNLITADLVLHGGVLATVAVEAPALKLAKGFYYDVEARNSKGDSSYVHVVPEAGVKARAATLVDSVLAIDGRYGAFGAPTDVKILGDELVNDKRMLDVSFAAMAPGGSTVPRRAAIAATAAQGSDDVLLLVASASETRWASGGEVVAKKAASSFRVASSRPTKLAAVKASDYRFEEQGGLRGLLMGDS